MTLANEFKPLRRRQSADQAKAVFQVENSSGRLGICIPQASGPN
jgi:hypothetical protein